MMVSEPQSQPTLLKRNQLRILKSVLVLTRWHLSEDSQQVIRLNPSVSSQLENQNSHMMIVAQNYKNGMILEK